MFEFFRKKPKYERLMDKVWANIGAKYRNLCIEIEQEKQEEYLIIILAYFKDTLTQLNTLLDKAGIHFQFIENAAELQEVNTEKRIFLFSEELMHNTTYLPAFLNKFSSHIQEKGVFYFVAEHHPLLWKDKELLNKIENLNAEAATVSFWLSLDTPLMKVFGGEKIIALLKRLGIGENEVIEHSFINKSIENAQKKLDKKVKIEVKTDSQEEWFRKNLGYEL